MCLPLNSLIAPDFSGTPGWRMGTRWEGGSGKVSLFSQNCHNTLPQTYQLKQHKCIFSNFWRPEVQGVSVGEVCSPWRLWGSVCSMPPQLLVLGGGPWRSLSCGCITPVSASVFTWPALPVSNPSPFSHEALPNPEWSHLKIISHICKDAISK